MKYPSLSMALLEFELRPSFHDGLNSLTAKRVPTGTENSHLPPRHGIPNVGIVWEVPPTATKLAHKHHHHGGAICPSYGVGSMDSSDLTQVTSLPKGSGEGPLAGFHINHC